MPTDEMLLSIPAMRAAAGEAVAVLRALSNEDRLLLLCQLSQGERSVGELEELLDIRQPTLSQQLSVLRAEGLVTTRRDGKYIYYAVATTVLGTRASSARQAQAGIHPAR